MPKTPREAEGSLGEYRGALSYLPPVGPPRQRTTDKQGWKSWDGGPSSFARCGLRSLDLGSWTDLIGI